MTDQDTLIAMGFDPKLVQQALKKTGGLNAAMDWMAANPNGVEETPQQVEDEDDDVQVVETANSLICDDCKKILKDATRAEIHANKTGHQNFSESTIAIKPLTPEEKQQKLLELQERMKQKRAEREQAEKLELKTKEKIKRATGAEMNALREKLEQEEMRKEVEEKRRRKEEDRLYKEKIRKQLEQDKLERKQRSSESVAISSQPSTAPVSSSPAAVNYDVARIQIRTPKGPLTTQLTPTDTLNTVIKFLETNNIRQPFTLSTSFPRKVYASSDYEKTLKELGLVPSCALILQQ